MPKSKPLTGYSQFPTPLFAGLHFVQGSGSWAALWAFHKLFLLLDLWCLYFLKFLSFTEAACLQDKSYKLEDTLPI